MFMFFRALMLALGLGGGFSGYSLHNAGYSVPVAPMSAPDDGLGSMPGSSGGSQPGQGGQGNGPGD
jgi:hypothetical protein